MDHDPQHGDGHPQQQQQQQPLVLPNDEQRRNDPIRPSFLRIRMLHNFHDCHHPQQQQHPWRRRRKRLAAKKQRGNGNNNDKETWGRMRSARFILPTMTMTILTMTTRIPLTNLVISCPLLWIAFCGAPMMIIMTTTTATTTTTTSAHLHAAHPNRNPVVVVEVEVGVVAIGRIEWKNSLII
jgi:hypothetical protein